MNKKVQASLKNVDKDDLVHHYWGTINYISSLIKSSELKSGLILSFYGILLNFVYQGIDALLIKITDDIILQILVVIWTLCTSVSIFFCIRCFIPKIEDKFAINMFFFRDIITKFGNIDEFSNTFFELSKNKDARFKQLGEQIFIMSKISDWKFRNVKRAISLLAAGLLIFFLTSIYFYFSL